MFKEMKFYRLIITFFLAIPNFIFAQNLLPFDTISDVSPIQFGIFEAKNSIERYKILYDTHIKALELGVNVNYIDIDTLSIEIPDNSFPIPLTQRNDFHNLTLIVTNNSNKQFLFEHVQAVWDSVTVDKLMVEKRDFSAVPELMEGDYLLQLQDLKPWVEKRDGYQYGAYRKDIMVIRNGLAQNHSIASYSTDSTKLVALYCPTNANLKTVSNLTIIRDTSSSQKTYCFNFEGVNNLKLSNVKIITPNPKNFYADEAITITNSVNILMEDVIIEGTYSQKSKYGYGILMNNVWNSAFVRLRASAEWGIFGTNNLSNTTLRNCEINRFDIHCYGRDVFIYNTKFSKLYNQFSSVFGTVLFENCRFSNFIPVLIETSYNAYTGFDLKFKNCTFEATPLRNYLVSIGKLDSKANPRPELASKCWPNVQIQNMTVKVDNKISKVFLFYPKGSAPDNLSVDYINSVSISGLRFVYSDTAHLADFVVVNNPIKSKKAISYNINNLELIPNVQMMQKQAQKKYSYPGSLTINLFRKSTDPVNISKSRLNYSVYSNSQYNINFTDCQIGRVRNNSKTNGTKRHYNRCTIYLNNADDTRYYIDNQAVYDNCTFIPCNPKMFVAFHGNNNDVSIKNCRTTKSGPLLYKGKFNNSDLKKFVLKGASK